MYKYLVDQIHKRLSRLKRNGYKMPRLQKFIIQFYVLLLLKDFVISLVQSKSNGKTSVIERYTGFDIARKHDHATTSGSLRMIGWELYNQK